MRAVIQRVTGARVEVAGAVVGEIGEGVLTLLGVARGDTDAGADYLVSKILNLRIFPDENGKMNRSLIETGGGLLVVSQFTLYGDIEKGRRPGFDEAAPSEVAKPIYEYFVQKARASGVTVKTGVFQAHMRVSLINDGPVTLICESKRALQKK
ncbi:MAG: D-aminoacyl-tRNA deacylase [Bryobacteraceae bacterium]